MEIFWPLERRYVSVEESRPARGTQRWCVFLEGDIFLGGASIAV